jgi:hypothetical protein
MNNIKALLVRGAAAAKAVDKARENFQANVESLITSENARRVGMALVGAVSPKMIEATVKAMEVVETVYEEMSTKVHVIHQALPAIAEALEKANEGEGLLSQEVLLPIVMEIKAEEAESNINPMPASLTCNSCKKEDPYLAPELEGIECRNCKKGHMLSSKTSPATNRFKVIMVRAVDGSEFPVRMRDVRELLEEIRPDEDTVTMRMGTKSISISKAALEAALAVN